jgi:AcrR family transcriptional regulator
VTALPIDGDKPNGPRSRKGERTRARIIEAAKLVFEEQGFRGARITDISERAELSHGSFYHYFDSKEDVFLEVVAAQEQRFSRNSILGSALADTTLAASVTDGLRVALRSYLEEYRAEARIVSVIEQVSRYHEPVRKVRQQRFTDYLHQAQEAIAELQRHGLADAQLDPAIAATVLIAMVTRFAELWLAQGALEIDFDHGVEQLLRLYTNALQLHDA